MNEPFEGKLYFATLPEDEAVLEPQRVLADIIWKVEPCNAPYLAGRAEKPSHEYGPLSGTPPTLPADWSEGDTARVIGDIGHSIKPGTSFIIADTLYFKRAEAVTAKLGYRPANAGEFLRLLPCIRDNWTRGFGYLLCYAGRISEYAILVKHFAGAPMSIIFDSHIGNDPRGYVSANAETCYVFVLEES